MTLSRLPSLATDRHSRQNGKLSVMLSCRQHQPLLASDPGNIKTGLTRTMLISINCYKPEMMLMQLNCKTQRLSVMIYDGKPYAPKCRRNCVRWKTRGGCRRLVRYNPTQIQMTLKSSMKQSRQPTVPRIILCIQLCPKMGTH